MKNEIIMLLLSFCILGCANTTDKQNQMMSEDEFQRYSKQKNEDGLIAIETSFKPTLELTDEIRNTSLENLIKQGKGQYSKIDQERMDEQRRINKTRARKMKEDLDDSEVDEEVLASLRKLAPVVGLHDMEQNVPVKLKYVPATSNLAKVYYLEDMGRFIEHNKNFYYNILNKMHEDCQKQQEQKNWDKYL